MDNTLTKCTRIQCWLNCKEKKINKYNNWANCLVLRERFNEIWLDDGTIELILIEFAWQPLNIRENWLFASFLFETFKLKWTFFYDGKKTSEMPTKESENLLEKSMKRKKKNYFSKSRRWKWLNVSEMFCAKKEWPINQYQFNWMSCTLWISCKKCWIVLRRNYYWMILTSTFHCQICYIYIIATDFCTIWIDDWFSIPLNSW